MKKKTITKAEYAHRRGVSRQMVGKYCALGMPTASNGHIDVEKADSWIADNIDKHSEPGRSNLTEARTRKENALASLRELELRKRKGELWEAGEAQAAMEAIVTATRSHFLLLSAKLAPEVAGNGNPTECQAIIDQAIREALQALSEYKLKPKAGK